MTRTVLNEDVDGSSSGISADSATQSDVEPVKKKARPSLSPSTRNNNDTKYQQRQQSSLLNFFSSSNKNRDTRRNGGASVSCPSVQQHEQQQPTNGHNQRDSKEENHNRTVATTTTNVAVGENKDEKNSQDGNNNNTKDNIAQSQSLDPIIPFLVPTLSSVSYESLYNNHVIVRRPKGQRRGQGQGNHDGVDKRIKIAGFDMDGTLLQWVNNSPGFWPNQLIHYEVWNALVQTKLQSLYDDEGYILVIFTNQGSIQGAHTGKKATMVKTLIDFLEHYIGRPLFAVISTKSPKKSINDSFHKPKPDMWNKILQSGALFGSTSIPPPTTTPSLSSSSSSCSSSTTVLDVSHSLFVGDSADDDDEQGGVDKKFASNVGLQFYTPEEYFGQSNQEVRARMMMNQLGSSSGGDPQNMDMPSLPPQALAARSALLGGYIQGPLLLILAGVQGSGKSTFCEHLVGSSGSGSVGDGTAHASKNNKNNKKKKKGDSNDPIQIDTDDDDDSNRRTRRRWVHLSQDTINNGKPGKREVVEIEARRSLREGNSVVIDRMHLDIEQRKYFVDLAHDVGVPVHVVVLNPSKKIISHRVKNRLNHPANVQGESGVRLALQSLNRLVLPTYSEKVQLISIVSTSFASIQLALRYSACILNSNSNKRIDRRLVVNRIALPVVMAASKTTSDTEPNKKDTDTTTTQSALTMPVITLGTMKMGRSTCTSTITAMVTAGFEAIDTAPTYMNEDKVGIALQDCTNAEEDIFIIAKVPKRAIRVEDVRTELDRTLQKLQRSTIDLLLLHWPSDVMAAKTLPDVWKCMEGFCMEGKCKALGVCNFNQLALVELLRCCSIPPAVNQIERHPLLSQTDLVDFCGRHNITIQAHTPLGQGKVDEEGGSGLLSNPIVRRVASETALSPAQVLLQWNLQQGVCVVPKCSQQDHAKEILELLELQQASSSTSDDGTTTVLQLLSPNQMMALDGLDSGKRYVVAPFMYGRASYCWGDRMPSTTRK